MKKQLWLRLKNYHFDALVPSQLKDHVRAIFGGPDASTQAFASKLSRKLGWTHSFALIAIEEYRKFVYLGVVSDFIVTPPKVIDQVWHEHLLFSRAYRDFCRDVLEREFDHNPELVPTDEQTEAFHTQYAATLEFYHDEFNVMPPADIWGTPKFVVDDSRIDMPRPTRRTRDDGMAYSGGDAPLFVLFEGDSGDGGGSSSSMQEFGGGGGFSGGGSGNNWGDTIDSGHGGDSGDGGDGGGGSGCSSGCGGGGD